MDGFWKIVIITLVLVITAGLVIIISYPQSSSKIEITPGFTDVKNQVDIYGAVNYPGHYEYSGYIRIRDAVNLAGGLSDDADDVRANLSKWVDDGETIIIPTRSSEQPTLTPLAEEILIVNINIADKTELMKLPGIGEKRAEDIIRLRESIGKFREREDLLQIQGISQNLLEKIYDLIILD